MELREQVEKAKQGDETAFCRLIDRRKADLYTVAYCYVKNKEDALDLVSETVYKAFISLPGLKHPEHFNTWLTRILINCSLDHLKKSKRTFALEEAEQQAGLREPISLSTDEETRLDLLRALDKLDEKLKTVVILKYFQDLTLEEVSRVLKCPVGTVKTYLHRALKILRLELKEGQC